MSFTSTFKYWNDPVATDGTNSRPNLAGPDGKIAPAPWVPYTCAGCNVGALGTANIELENNQDVAQFYAANRPEAHDSNLATHYLGLAVHCAKDSSCAPARSRPR